MNIITLEQNLILDLFRNDEYLRSNFYFTGGTALSLYYLQHRESIDLDFFSANNFDIKTVTLQMTQWGSQHNFSVTYIPYEEKTHVFNLTFKDGKTVKVDFAYYPYKQIGESKIERGITVDSLVDIAVNKLLTTQQRTEVKDFVDLYFLLPKFTIGELLEGVRIKFHLEIDPFIFASDFLKVENFDFLPLMVKPLSIPELKAYFREKAKEIGAKETI